VLLVPTASPAQVPALALTVPVAVIFAQTRVYCEGTALRTASGAAAASFLKVIVKSFPLLLTSETPSRRLRAVLILFPQPVGQVSPSSDSV